MKRTLLAALAALSLAAAVAPASADTITPRGYWDSYYAGKGK